MGNETFQTPNADQSWAAWKGIDPSEYSAEPPRHAAKDVIYLGFQQMEPEAAPDETYSGPTFGNIPFGD